MRITSLLLLLAAASASVCGQEPLAVATIDGKPVLAAEIEREVAEAYRGRKLTDEQRRPLLLRARDQVIDRRLVLKRLEHSGDATSKEDVDYALARLEKQVAEQGIELAEHYQRLGVTREEVRQTLHWKLSWQKYLERQLTDQNLQKYFEQHRADFDGTQLRVAHILIKPASDEAAARDLATKQAEQLRDSILNGKTSFAEAARKHSTGPSAKGGGDIGWIQRNEPMPEAFSAAAFALKQSEVSPPVTTTFGIHLIQVQEVKAGEKTWQDAAERLRPAVTLYLFRWLAHKERMSAKIERREGWPP